MALFSHNRKLFAHTDDTKHYIYVQDIENGSLKSKLLSKLFYVYGFQSFNFSKDDSLMVASCYDSPKQKSHIVVWRISDGEIIYYQTHESYIKLVDISPDNRYLSLVLKNNIIEIWEIKIDMGEISA